MDDGASDLRVRVLGAVAVTRGGVDVRLRGRRLRAVLAVLVLARGQVVTAEHLVGRLRDPGASADPAGVLESDVHRLRRLLGADAEASCRRDAIVGAESGAGYALRVAPDAVDAWRFEQAVRSAADLSPADAVRVLEQALRLWRGPPFAELAAEPWAQAEVARLTQLRAVARERLLGARLEVGDAPLVASQVEALVAQDPLRAEPRRLLDLALDGTRRQGDALAASRPSAASRGRPVVSLSRAASRRPAGSSAPAAPADLVARDRELGVLARAVDDLLSGVPRVVLVEGSAGIGKTRLLTEAVRTARAAEVPVLSARGSELERSSGFGAVRQLFEPRVADRAGREALLGGAAAGALPVFEHVRDDEPVDRGFAVLHGLYRLTAALTSDGPAVLTVDDVQWCDSASLRFLAYLVTRLHSLPVLVVMTLRTGEEHVDEALLTGLAQDSSTTVLRPRPLPLPATQELVRQALGDAGETFVAACHHATSGNPLLLRQLLRALQDEGVRPDASPPDVVRAVGMRAVSGLVRQRLRRMPADRTAVARAVAVLGRGADLPAVAALAHQPEEQAAAALDALGRSEVLTDDQTPVFVHPLVRDAVYDDIPASERALHHERAARVLQERAAEPGAVAAHLLLSPRRGSAATVALLRSAARTAAAQGASDSAVVLLRRALEEPVARPERVDVLLELGTAEARVDGPSAVGHLTDAYGELTDSGQRADVAMVITRTHVFASEPGVATAFARAAAAELPPALHDPRQGLLALQRITGYLHGLPRATYRSGPEPDVVGEGPGARMLAATLAFELLVEGEERARAVHLAAFALDGDHLLAADDGLLWVAAANVLLLGDVDVDDFWRRAGRHAHVTGSLFAALSVNLWRGYAEWRHGCLDDALQSVSEAANQRRMWGGSVGLSYAAAFTAGIHLDRGDVAAARRVLDDARTLGDVGEGARLLREIEARALLEEGRAADALAALDLTDRRLRATSSAVWAPWRALQAQALAALDRLDEAGELAEEHLTLLRRWGAPSALGPALRLLGELRGPAGTSLLREAVEVLGPTHAVLELARAQLALGRCAEVAGDEAVDLLRRAAGTARSCGAHGVLRDATAELAARRHRLGTLPDADAGLTPSVRRVLDATGTGPGVDGVAPADVMTASGAATGTTGFTRKETDVLVLVAAGWTDARIARHLGISQATVRQRLNTARVRVGAVNRTHLVARWSAPDR